MKPEFVPWLLMLWTTSIDANCIIENETFKSLFNKFNNFTLFYSYFEYRLSYVNNIEVNSGSRLIVVLLMLLNKINLVKMIMSIKIGNMNVNK